jgi:hypothetical protein
MRYFLTIVLLFCLHIANCQSLPVIISSAHALVHKEPYAGKFKEPEYVKKEGFNAMVLPVNLNMCLTYDNYEPNIVPQGSAARKWITDKAVLGQLALNSIKSAHLNAYLNMDFLIFPAAIWKKYGDQIRSTEGKVKETGAYNNENATKPDINKPLTQTLLRAQIDALFTNFPQLDGIISRFGETYLHDYPHHMGGNPVSNVESAQINDQITFIKILKEEVCEKRHKKLFFRTWDFGFHFHNNPAFYLAVTNAITPNENLFFSIKYQQGDFYRMVNFNPCLGIGKHQQIVESQSQMEVYGKGAHPYYTGQGVIDGWPETKYQMQWWNNAYLKDKDRKWQKNNTGLRGVKDVLKSGLIKGVWVWAEGGGWDGPYVKNEIWLDLNTYVVGHWAQNTSKSEPALFEEFAERIGCKGLNADLFRSLCLLSVEAVRKGQMSDFTDNEVWWARDEYFCAGYNTRILNDIVKKQIESVVLAEKAEATAMWLQMEAIAEQLQIQDTITLHAIKTSTTYGRIKYALIEQMWYLMIANAQYQATKTLNTAEVAAHLQKYDALWTEWKQLAANNTDCASIATDLSFRKERKGSIGELVDKLRTLIAPAK